MASPTNFYLITNRAPDAKSKGGYGIDIAPQGALTFFSGPATSRTTFTAASQDDWLAALQSDLVQSSGGGPAYATIFVHGYGVSFSKALTVFPTYFSNLANTPTAGAGYPGVFIGFDWPSNDSDAWQSTAFQEAKGKARDTATESFPLLLPILQAIQATSGVAGVTLSAICHSMGNYLMYAGAGAFQPAGAPPLFNEIICAAAMLDVDGFNNPDSATPCADIVAATSGSVTIYFSGNDDVLPKAEKATFDGYNELGIFGPTYDSTLLPQTIGLDCSAVVNDANAQQYEVGQFPILTHTAYFFIPEVLEDIAYTLKGGQGGDGDRTPILGTTTGFTMNP